MNPLVDFKGQVKLEKAHPDIVKAIQSELVRIGYYLNIDGVAGPKTLAAFAQFKEDNFLEHLDLIGPSTVTELLKAFPAPVTKNDHIKLIVKECLKQGIVSNNQIAYVLATVKHETAHTYEPIDEYGGARTRYAPYWGRGYVQLTWKTNYAKYSRLTGRDLVTHPDLAKQPLIAVFILVHGFRTGGFTGKGINDYINDNACNFAQARRCINGMDQSVLIANYAQEWLQQLKPYIKTV